MIYNLHVDRRDKMIVLAYDHRGYGLMTKVKKYLESKKLEYVEYASSVYDASDSYAQFAKEANKKVLENSNNRGIYCCRTGIGITMSANRQKGIRAGLCHDTYTVRLARNDDNINVLCISGETAFCRVKKMIDVFLNTDFEGGRHIERLAELDK